MVSGREHYQDSRLSPSKKCDMSLVYAHTENSISASTSVFLQIVQMSAALLSVADIKLSRLAESPCRRDGTGDWWKCITAHKASKEASLLQASRYTPHYKCNQYIS
jgi:hypothetical protein